jgi:hypothetical protein
MYDAFWKEGVDEAQYFKYFTYTGDPTVRPGFTLCRGNDTNGVQINPTGLVAKLYQQYARGNLLNLQNVCPSYTINNSDTDIVVPMLVSHAFYDANAMAGERLVVIITNRHRTEPANCYLAVHHFQAASLDYTIKWIGAASEKSLDATEQQQQYSLSSATNPDLTIELPPHSVTAVIILGTLNQ